MTAVEKVEIKFIAYEECNLKDSEAKEFEKRNLDSDVFFELTNSWLDEISAEPSDSIMVLKNNAVKDKKGEDKRLFTIEDHKVTANGYVGVINPIIKDRNGKEIRDITVRIGTRFEPEAAPNHFLRYVFSRAFELGDRGEVGGWIFRDMDTPADEDDVLDILLICLFFKQMHDAMKTGFYRQYRDFAHNDARVRGRIDISRHTKENLLSNGKICYSTREYSVDNPVNRLILKAAQFIEKKNRKVYLRLMNQYDICKKGILMLQNEIADIGNDSVHKVIERAHKRVTHSVYRNYEPLRQTAIGILKRLGLNSFADSRWRTSGILLYMPDLWEAFLGNTMMRKIAAPGEKYAQQIYSCKDSDSNKIKEERPDFSFESKGLILDAKYKPWWRDVYDNGTWGEFTMSDYYQVAEYMFCLRNKGGNQVLFQTGGIVFPVKGGKGEHWVDAETYMEPYKIKEIPIYDRECAREKQDHKFLLVPVPVPDEPEYKEFCKKMDSIVRFIAGKIIEKSCPNDLDRQTVG